MGLIYINLSTKDTLELAPASPPRFVTFYNGRIFYLFYSLTRLFKAGFFLERSFFRTTHIGVPLPRAREPHSAGGMLPPDVGDLAPQRRELERHTRLTDRHHPRRCSGAPLVRR